MRSLRNLMVGCALVFFWGKPATVCALDYDGLPPGEGRVEVFAWCTACHSARIIRQQGLSRADWDETLVWMVEEQGMQEPDAEMRKKILDYLSEQFSPERPHYMLDGE